MSKLSSGETKKPLPCSFCGKSQHEVRKLIAGPTVFICDECVDGYGLSAPFRQGLTARKLAWAVGIPRHLKVYPADVQMIWPVAGRGRPRQRHVPNILIDGG